MIIALSIFINAEIVFPQFVLDLNWQVVAGEESKEADVENQRELRVLEAVYPRSSAIPTKFDTSLFLLI